LSGIAFAVLLCLAWFSNGAETPHYTAPDHDWTTWANNTEMKGRFAAFFALLAGLVFLPFAATIRDTLAAAEQKGHGAVRLSQVAYAGGLIGVTSFVIATVTFSGASAEGSVFGYGFFPGVVALVTWSIATSIARYRAVQPAADGSTATEAPAYR